MNQLPFPSITETSKPQMGEHNPHVKQTLLELAKQLGRFAAWRDWQAHINQATLSTNSQPAEDLND